MGGNLKTGASRPSVDQETEDAGGEGGRLTAGLCAAEGETEGKLFGGCLQRHINDLVHSECTRRDICYGMSMRILGDVQSLDSPCVRTGTATKEPVDRFDCKSLNCRKKWNDSCWWCLVLDRNAVLQKENDVLI
mmetsp:Transcript_26834/g.52686  ORF Transcript_26834/g.52686 Transcript_26834/m.52686 type:complete len:134 (-) Transcript_26834:237-638(-)